MMKNDESTREIDDAIDHVLKLSDNEWFKNYIKSTRSRFIEDLDFILEYLQGSKKIADFGAAPFVIPQALHQLGHQVYSFDVKPERFEKIKDLEFEVIKLDLDKWNDEKIEPSFDFILFNELFEHLRGNLIQTMTNVYKSLKPGGKVMLTTPNFRSAMGIYKFLFKGTSYAVSNDLYFEWNKLSTIGHMGHIREYTTKELKNFFEKIGFKVEYSKQKPVRFGPGIKNSFFYHLEKISGLGSQSIFLLTK